MTFNYAGNFICNGYDAVDSVELNREIVTTETLSRPQAKHAYGIELLAVNPGHGWAEGFLH